jgi:hypothetical protein
VDFHLTDCRTEGRDEDREAETADRIGELRHGLHTKRRRERRGAAVRSCGNAWNIEAITATSGDEGGEQGGQKMCMSSIDSSVVRWAGGAPSMNPAYPPPLTGGSDDPLRRFATASPDPSE